MHLGGSAIIFVGFLSVYLAVLGLYMSRGGASRPLRGCGRSRGSAATRRACCRSGAN